MSRFRHNFPKDFTGECERVDERGLPANSWLNESSEYDMTVVERAGRVGKRHVHYLIRGTGQQFLVWLPEGATIDDPPRPLLLYLHGPSGRGDEPSRILSLGEGTVPRLLDDGDLELDAVVVSPLLKCGVKDEWCDTMAQGADLMRVVDAVLRACNETDRGGDRERSRRAAADAVADAVAVERHAIYNEADRARCAVDAVKRAKEREIGEEERKHEGRYYGGPDAVYQHQWALKKKKERIRQIGEAAFSEEIGHDARYIDVPEEKMDGGTRQLLPIDIESDDEYEVEPPFYAVAMEPERRLRATLAADANARDPAHLPPGCRAFRDALERDARAAQRLVGGDDAPPPPDLDATPQAAWEAGIHRDMRDEARRCLGGYLAHVAYGGGLKTPPPSDEWWPNGEDRMPWDRREVLDDSRPALPPVDWRRLYCTGASCGALGCYALACRLAARDITPDCPKHPSEPEPIPPFAAIAPCGGSGHAPFARVLCATPAWFWHGAHDDVRPVDETDAVVAELRSLGAPVRYTRLRGDETGAPPAYAPWMYQHDAWTPAYAADSPLWPWLFSHTFGDWEIELEPEPPWEFAEAPPTPDADGFRSPFGEDGNENEPDPNDDDYDHLVSSLN